MQDGQPVPVRRATVLKRESHLFLLDNQVNIKGVIKTEGVSTPQDRLKEKFERVKRIKEARETGKVEKYVRAEE